MVVRWFSLHTMYFYSKFNFVGQLAVGTGLFKMVFGGNSAPFASAAASISSSFAIDFVTLFYYVTFSSHPPSHVNCFTYVGS